MLTNMTRSRGLAVSGLLADDECNVKVMGQ